jgi:hypothetical protein
MKKLLILFLLALPVFAQQPYDGSLVQFGRDSVSAHSKMLEVQYKIDSAQTNSTQIFGKGQGFSLKVLLHKNTGVYKSVTYLDNPTKMTIDELIVKLAPKVGFNAEKFNGGYKWMLQSTAGNPVEVTAFEVGDVFEVTETDLALEAKTKE